MNKNNLKVIESIPMGDDDIRKYLPNAKILTYPQLAKYNKIEEVLPNNKDYFIVLYLDSPNSGHWETILRYDDKIEVFDSYGKQIDNPLKWQSVKAECDLGECEKYLTNLLDNSDLPIYYNNIDYQKDNPNIQSCGRHAVYRIIQMLNNNLDGTGYYKHMKAMQKKTKLNFDDIVTNYINQ